MNSASHKKKTIFSFLFVALLIFLFLLPIFVFALEINYPKVPGATPPQDFINTAPSEQILSLYVLYIFNLVIWLSGIIAFGVIVYAGIRYLTSAGKPEAILNARKQITDAFLGILILLSSFIILKAINPQLVVLNVPKTESPKVIEKPEIPAPPLEPTNTSIDTQLLLGRIISDYLFSATRTKAIKDNAKKTSEIAQTLKEQVDDLKKEVDKCNCGEAKPKCKGTINIGGYGADQKCQSQEGQSCNVFCTDSCSSDVCANERKEIENLEKKNLQKLDELKAEQNKSIEQLKQIRIELGKLQLLKDLMTKCPVSYLDSLASFFDKMVLFKDEKWVLREVRVWNMINIIYYNEKLKQKVYDWATFYCPVSGKLSSLPKQAPPIEVPSTENPEEVLSLACKSEVPVGDIIDRSERITNLLIKRLETLINLDRQMAQAIDELHVLISQCSSQQPMCCSFCIEVRIKKVTVCIRQCIGQACPFSKIKEKVDEISRIQGKIEETVNDTDEQNMGIIPIIDKVIPKILEDLEYEIRLPMRECIIKGSDKVLFDCQRLIGALDPAGDIIRTCCNKEPVFNECLDKCYLQEGEQKYKQCLTDCLDKRAEETGLQDVSWCRHQLNFFCCNIEKELIE